MVLLIVVIGTFMTTLDAGVVAVSYPRLVSVLDTSVSTVLWITVGYYLVSTGIMLTIGWLGDITGRRNIYVLGLLVFTVGLGLNALSQNIGQLISARLLQGIGHAMILATNLAILANSFPLHQRGKALGIEGGAVGLGLGMGPVVGGLLLDSLGWQSTFYTRIPFGIIGVVLTLLYLPNDSHRVGRLHVDYAGASLLFLAMGSFLLMVNQGGRIGFGSLPVIALGAAALALVASFIFVERRTSTPVVDLGLFRIGQFRNGLIIQAFHYLSVGFLQFLLPFYFISAVGYSASLAGLLLTVLYSLRLVSSPLSGLMSDVMGFRIPHAVGMAGVVAGVLALAFLGETPHLWWIVAGLLLAGIGSGLFEPANNGLIMGGLPLERMGTATASIAAGRQLFISTGIAVAASVFTIRVNIYASVPPAEASPVVISQAVGEALIAGLAFAVLGLAWALASRDLDRATAGPGQQAIDA